MKRYKHLGKGILALGLAFSAAVAGAFDASVVDNRFGTDRQYGSCVLGPCVPHGSAHPSPDSQWPSPNPHPVAPGQRHGTGAPTSGWWPGDPIVGFSQLHCQGSGGRPSYGIFRLGIPTSSMTVEESHPYRFQVARGSVPPIHYLRWLSRATLDCDAQTFIALFGRFGGMGTSRPVAFIPS